MVPATTGPEWMPIETPSGGRPAAVRLSFSSATRSCMPRAQRTAWAAPLSLPSSKRPNTTSTPSPRNLSTKPPQVRTQAVRTVKSSLSVATSLDLAGEQPVPHGGLDDPPERAEDTLLLTQRQEERVHPVLHDADLVARAHPDTAIERARADAPQDRRHLRQRSGEGARQQQREDEPDGHVDGERHLAGPGEALDDARRRQPRVQAGGGCAHQPERREERHEGDRDQE